MDYEDRLSVWSVKMAIAGPKTIATHVMHLSIETPTPPTPGQGGGLTWHHYKS